MPDNKPTPAEKAAQKEINRFEAKLKAAPHGSRLAANMNLRIAKTKASLEADDDKRAELEGAAMGTHREAVAEIQAAEELLAREAAAAAAEALEALEALDAEAAEATD